MTSLLTLSATVLRRNPATNLVVLPFLLWWCIGFQTLFLGTIAPATGALRDTIRIVWENAYAPYGLLYMGVTLLAFILSLPETMQALEEADKHTRQK